MCRKPAIVLGLSLFSLLFLFHCSGIHSIERADVSMISLTEMQEDPENIAALFTSIQEGKEVIMLIPAGESLPIHILIDLPFATLSSNENMVSFEKDVYLYFSIESLKVSPDGERWTDIDNMGAIKELFGFETGSISFGIKSTEEIGTYMELMLSTE